MKTLYMCDKCKENTIKVSQEDNDFFKANEDVVVWCKECCEGLDLESYDARGEMKV